MATNSGKISGARQIDLRLRSGAKAFVLSTRARYTEGLRLSREFTFGDWTGRTRPTADSGRLAQMPNSASVGDPVTGSQVADVVELLVRRLGRRPRVAELARELSLGELALRRFWKRRCGSSLRVWIGYGCIRYAVRLIAAGTKVEAAICLAGFKHHGHFCREVRGYFGMNPRDVKAAFANERGREEERKRGREEERKRGREEERKREPT